jgi:hypothetical protein
VRDFGIFVFGHTRVAILGDLLESLKRQNAVHHVDLWLDGHQGKAGLKSEVQVTRRMADSYDVGVRRYHHGQLGFRKLMLQAMQSAVQNYRHLLFLEDDCFPSRFAVEVIRSEIEEIQDRAEVFSVYGHPFLMAEETGYCSRFQGWGWATTAEKLAPYVDRLIDCYSMSEHSYLNFTSEALTPEVVARLDVTPPRQPSVTLRAFFAWDETLALLTAMDGKVHKPTRQRVVFNCGIGTEQSHFGNNHRFLNPPFNLVPHSQVWEYF